MELWSTSSLGNVFRDLWVSPGHLNKFLSKYLKQMVFCFVNKITGYKSIWFYMNNRYRRVEPNCTVILRMFVKLQISLLQNWIEWWLNLVVSSDYAFGFKVYPSVLTAFRSRIKNMQLMGWDGGDSMNNIKVKDDGWLVMNCLPCSVEQTSYETPQPILLWLDHRTSARQDFQKKGPEPGTWKSSCTTS